MRRFEGFVSDGIGLVLTSWLSICTDLHVVESAYPVCRNFRRLLFAYGLLFVSLENEFEFSAILSVISVSKQLNGSRRANYQEARHEKPRSRQ